MSEKYLVTNLHDKISIGLSKRSNSDNFVKDVMNYKDKNSDILYAFGPIKQLLHNEKDKQHLYNTCEISRDEVKSILNKSSYVKQCGALAKEPFNILSVIAIRYYELVGKPEYAKIVLLHLTFSRYSSKYDKYFKYDPNENLMRSVMNNLSKKFLLKQTASMFKALEITANGAHENCKKRLLIGEDRDIINYLQALDTRINGLMKNISNEFYKTKEDQLSYINLDKDNLNEDKYHLTDNNSFLVDRLTNKTVLRLTSNGPDYKLISIAAQINDTAEIYLRNAINNILDQKIKEIDEFIKLVLSIFIFDNHGNENVIMSNDFLIESLKIYRKSNTNDKNIQRIKDIIDEWLTDCSDKYKKTMVRTATLADFRRAVYTFFILTIQQSAIN